MSRWNKDCISLKIYRGQTGFDMVTVGLMYETEVLRSVSKAVIALTPFHTDLSSEPWFIGWKLDRQEYIWPAIVHDFMLQHRDLFPDFTRKDIDRGYREALLDQGIGKTECHIRYAGVRINSWWREERFY